LADDRKQPPADTPMRRRTDKESRRTYLGPLGPFTLPVDGPQPVPSESPASEPGEKGATC
jgi:hypothetical protein